MATFLLSSFSFGAAQNVSSPAQFDTNEKVYSMADMHGDLDAAKKAMQGLGLYSPITDSWTGGKSHFVINGDLVDRGPETRALLDFVMRMEKEAEVAGGKVHTLLGNHELLVVAGVLEYTHPNDVPAFREFRKSLLEKPSQGFINAFRGDTKYAQWFRSRNTMVRVNNTLFVHAGVEDWALRYTIEEINEAVKSWIRYYQGVGPKPPLNTRWVTEGKGPLWTRTFASFDRSFSESNGGAISVLKSEVLDKILAHFSVERIVVGHSIVKSVKIAIHNPIYPDRVFMTDTGASVAYGEIISAYQYTQKQVQGWEISRITGAKIRGYRSTTAAEQCKTVVGL